MSEPSLDEQAQTEIQFLNTRAMAPMNTVTDGFRILVEGLPDILWRALVRYMDAQNAEQTRTMVRELVEGPRCDDGKDPVMDPNGE